VFRRARRSKTKALITRLLVEPYGWVEARFVDVIELPTSTLTPPMDAPMDAAVRGAARTRIWASEAASGAAAVAMVPRRAPNPTADKMNPPDLAAANAAFPS
jgi:hypothetical protein